MASGDFYLTRDIIRSSAIVGAGSLINILGGILKNKAIALILGPSGIGLFGIWNSILTTAATITGMGLSSSGVRQIAEAQADGEEFKMAATRRSLAISSSAFGLLGALTLILFREQVAELAMADRSHSQAVAWLGIGLWATVASGSQTALLNGLRRTADLTWVNIVGAIVSLIVAVTAVWLWQATGVLVAVIAAPFASLITAWLFAQRVETDKVKLSVHALIEPLVKLLNLGVVFMLTGLMVVGTQLAIRVIVTRELGIEATGHFQAAWNISVLYLGFVLGAMGTDYYPRLTEVARDALASNKMINEQAEVALLFSGPVILAMLTLTPWIVALLYSQAFCDTTAVLKWQILGDIFKVASWSLAFLFVAQARTGVFFLTELAGNLVYIGCVWFGLAIWGLEATGIGFLVCYVFYFFLVWMLVRKLNGFVWSNRTVRTLSTVALCSCIVFFLRSFAPSVFLPVGLAFTLAFASYSFLRVSRILK
jgi:PST family polysaccharide transporter